MSYVDAKRARDRALVEALHGDAGGESVRGLPPITLAQRDERRQLPVDDEDSEPGWRGPSFAIDSSLILGALTED